MVRVPRLMATSAVFGSLRNVDGKVTSAPFDGGGWYVTESSVLTRPLTATRCVEPGVRPPKLSARSATPILLPSVPLLSGAKRIGSRFVAHAGLAGVSHVGSTTFAVFFP